MTSVHLERLHGDESIRIGVPVSTLLGQAMNNPHSLNIYSPMDLAPGVLPAVERVFISHRRADKPLAKAVTAVLQAVGLHYWFDDDDADTQRAAELGMAGVRCWCTASSVVSDIAPRR